METSTVFASSAQEGHPHTESAGSASAAVAEGYVTVVADCIFCKRWSFLKLSVFSHKKSREG